MHIKKPWEYNPKLKQEYLLTIALKLQDIYQTAYDELKEDSAYSKGTVSFDRAYNFLKDLGNLKNYSWFHVAKTSMDIVFKIEGVPFRFFSTSNYEKPKAKVFIRDPLESLFPDEDMEPCQWRFLIRKPLIEIETFDVAVVGYDANQVLRAKWSLAEYNGINTDFDEDINIDLESIEIPEAEISKRDKGVRKNG